MDSAGPWRIGLPRPSQPWRLRRPHCLGLRHVVAARIRQPSAVASGLLRTSGTRRRRGPEAPGVVTMMFKMWLTLPETYSMWMAWPRKDSDI